VKQRIYYEMRSEQDVQPDKLLKAVKQRIYYEMRSEQDVQPDEFLKEM